MAVTGSRREARERALGLCYELEVRDLGVDALIEQQPAPPDEYAVQLVRGVEAHGADVDELLRKFSEHWACLLYTSPSPRDTERSRMPSSA